MRFALVSCSNYPAGYFNPYAAIAKRMNLDAVVHVGDYIYEFAEGEYGAGAAIKRIPQPSHEAIALADYRARYATYRTDPDLQEAHRLFPFIAVWDDHELANDAWAGGAINHNPEKGEGDWATRRAAAYKAYLEWMPIRESSDPAIHLYRTIRFGTLADLVMRSVVASYVRDGFPAELVEAAKRTEVASALFRRNSISDLATVWSQALAAEGRNSPDDNVEAIKRVTVADVNRVARQFLKDSNSITATLIPKPTGEAASGKGFGGGEQLTAAPTKPVQLPACSAAAR